MIFENKEHKAKYQDWLDSLKVGDEVVIQSYGFGRERYWRTYTVEKITPSGRKNLNNGMVVNTDGSIRGDNYNHIQELTKEISDRIWMSRAVNKIERELILRELSKEHLVGILKIMREHEDNKKDA